MRTCTNGTLRKQFTGQHTLQTNDQTRQKKKKHLVIDSTFRGSRAFSFDATMGLLESVHCHVNRTTRGWLIDVLPLTLASSRPVLSWGRPWKSRANTHTKLAVHTAAPRGDNRSDTTHVNIAGPKGADGTSRDRAHEHSNTQGRRQCFRALTTGR